MFHLSHTKIQSFLEVKHTAEELEAGETMILMLEANPYTFVFPQVKHTAEELEAGETVI